jgi:hypothetical protein
MRTLTVSGIPPLAATTQVWKFGGYVWSDRIIVPECNKEGWTVDANGWRCRSYQDDVTLRYYYDFEYTNNNKTNLCPYPWGLPSGDQLRALASAVTASNLLTAWGAGGLVNSSGNMALTNDGVVGGAYADYNFDNYWVCGSLYCWERLHYPASGHDVGLSPLSAGMQVRCVK